MPPLIWNIAAPAKRGRKPIKLPAEIVARLGKEPDIELAKRAGGYW